MNITERQLQILEALARFKYLTAQQLAFIAGIKHSSNTSRLLKDLNERKKPLVDYKGFGIIPVHGRLARVFFLTKYGKEVIVEALGLSPESVKYVQNKHSLFQRDYFHRCDTVNFNIHFQKWLEASGYDLEFFTYYFDKTGSNRNQTGEIANSIQVRDFKIVPDGIGLFSTPERAFLFLFEQHNGKDKKRAVDQIMAHCVAISEGGAPDKYGIQSAARVYYVFESESCLKSTLSELLQLPEYENFQKFFLFKSKDSLESDFFGGWLYASGEVSSFI